jgi:hypothetical protein
MGLPRKVRQCGDGIRGRNARRGCFAQLQLTKKRGRIGFQCGSQHHKLFGIGVLGIRIGVLGIRIGVLDIRIGVLGIRIGVLDIGVLVLIARAVEALLSAFGKFDCRRLNRRFINTHFDHAC